MIHLSIYFGPVLPLNNCVVILHRDLLGILSFIYSDIFYNFADLGYFHISLVNGSKNKLWLDSYCSDIFSRTT